MKDVIKHDYTDAILPLAKKVWFRYLESYLLLSLLPLFLLVTLYLGVLNDGFYQEVSQLNFENYQAIQQEISTIEQIIQQYIFTPFSLLYLIVAVVILIVLNSWMTYTFLQFNADTVEGIEHSFFEILQTITSTDLGRIIGFSVIVWIGSMIYFWLMSALANIVAALFVIGFLAYPYFVLKFVLALPAIVYEKTPLLEAFRFSWESMSSKTALGFYMGIIVLMVMMFVVSLIIDAILALLGGGWIQQVISNLIQIGITAFVYALFFSALSSLYYYIRFEQKQVISENEEK